MDWQPSAIVWYVDGVEHYRYTNASHIPAENMYLLLNLAVGGDWPGTPNSSTVFPAVFEVDYARVWSSRPADGGVVPTATAIPRVTATPTPTRRLTPISRDHQVFVPLVSK